MYQCAKGLEKTATETSRLLFNHTRANTVHNISVSLKQ